MNAVRPAAVFLLGVVVGAAGWSDLTTAKVELDTGTVQLPNDLGGINLVPSSTKFTMRGKKATYDMNTTQEQLAAYWLARVGSVQAGAIGNWDGHGPNEDVDDELVITCTLGSYTGEARDISSPMTPVKAQTGSQYFIGISNVNEDDIGPFTDMAHRDALYEQLMRADTLRLGGSNTSLQLSAQGKSTLKVTIDYHAEGSYMNN